MKKTIGSLVKIVVTLGLFIFLFRPETFGLREDLFGNITLGGLLDELKEAGARNIAFWLLFATVVKLMGMTAGVIRWRYLLQGQGLHIPLPYMIQSWFVGRYIGIFLPGTIGLDGYRLYDSSMYTGEVIKSTTVIAVEKLIGLIALSFLVFLTFPLGFTLLDMNPITLVITLVIVGTIVTLCMLLLLNPRVIQVVVAILPTPKSIRSKVNTLGAAVSAYRSHRILLLKAVFFGLMVHLGTCFMYFGTMMAIRAENTSLWDILFASPLMITGTVLGPSVGGEGIREFVFVALLGGKSSALTAVLIAHLGWWVGEFVPFIIGAPIYVLRSRPSKKQLQDQLAKAQTASAEVDTDLHLGEDEIKRYRLKFSNGIVAGVLGGLVAGSVYGILESFWMTRYISGLSEHFAFVWGPFVYGLLFVAFSLGAAGLLAFFYSLFDKFPHAAITNGLCGGGALAAGLFLFGEFRYKRDILSDAALGLSDHLIVLAVAVAAGAVLAVVLTLLTLKLRENWKLSSAALGAAFVAVLIGGFIASAIIEPSVTERSFAPKKDASGPNIILIAIDTLRADYLPLFSDKAVAKTPHLDALGEDSVTFQNAFSQASWTKPSFGTIMTGMYPEGHGATAKMGQNSFLPDGVETLAEVLHDGGYYTCGFANNPNVFSIFGFDQGYVEYTDMAPSLYFGASNSAAELTVYQILRRVHGRIFRKLVITDFYQPAEIVTQKALDWVDEKNPPEGAPFFLFLHYMDPHDPFMDADEEGVGYARRDMKKPPAELLDPMKKAYNDEIEHLDTHLGALIKGLKDRGLYDDSVIMLTSDHGEEFLEHEGWWHGNTLYDEQIKIPLLVKLPGGASGGERVNGLARNIDIATTLIELAGLSAPVAMRGIALATRESGPVNPDTAYSYAEIDFEGNVVQAVRTMEEKLIHANVDNTRGLEPIELYDMVADPNEQTNLAGGGNERQALLLQTLKDMQASILAGAVEPSMAKDVSADVAEQLEALGYLE